MALLATCLAVLAVQLTGHAGIDLLRYDRAGVAAGQWWRLITGHFAHLTFRHAALDLAGLILLWALFARDLRPWQWSVVILAAMATIDCGLWFRDPGIAWYVGISGVLHGVLAAAVFVRLRRGDLEGWLLAGLLLAKIAYEQIHGPLPFAGDMPVVVDAHLYGALGGLAAALALGLSDKAALARAAAPSRARAR
jgi:rhomboid family GlyGly-CTERM serine protease